MKWLRNLLKRLFPAPKKGKWWKRGGEWVWEEIEE
jgi:hypothetical protein